MFLNSKRKTIVNIRTDIKEASTKFGKKLQQAHDLFHQDEFEQASYMYQDIIETRSDITDLNLSFVNRFVKACEKKMVIGEEKKEKQEYKAPYLTY